MADRFYTDIELPIVSTSPAPPDSGFVSLFGKSNDIYAMLPDGSEFPLSFMGVPVYIQDVDPALTGKYIWVQTNVGSDPTKHTVWFKF